MLFAPRGAFCLLGNPSCEQWQVPPIPAPLACVNASCPVKGCAWLVSPTPSSLTQLVQFPRYWNTIYTIVFYFIAVGNSGHPQLCWGFSLRGLRCRRRDVVKIGSIEFKQWPFVSLLVLGAHRHPHSHPPAPIHPHTVYYSNEDDFLSTASTINDIPNRKNIYFHILHKHWGKLLWSADPTKGNTGNIKQINSKSVKLRQLIWS